MKILGIIRGIGVSLLIKMKRVHFNFPHTHYNHQINEWQLPIGLRDDNVCDSVSVDWQLTIAIGSHQSGRTQKGGISSKKKGQLLFPPFCVASWTDACNFTCQSKWIESCPAFSKQTLHEILVTIMNILEKLPNSAFENLNNIKPSELVPVVKVYPQLVVTASDYFGSNVKCNTIPPKKRA